MEQKDWDDLERQMGLPFGHMHLQCDGFKVSLMQEIAQKSRSYYTAVYVDGFFKGEWLRVDEQGNAVHEQARRFYARRTRSLYSAKDKERLRKIFGKKEADKAAAKKLVSFVPEWKSFNALKRHLLANNTSITRLQE